MDTSVITLMGLMGWVMMADNLRTIRNTVFSEPPVIPKRGYGTACKACNEDGLHWVKTSNGKWCLFHIAKIHRCPVSPWHPETLQEIEEDDNLEHKWNNTFSNIQARREQSIIGLIDDLLAGENIQLLNPKHGSPLFDHFGELLYWNNDTEMYWLKFDQDGNAIPNPDYATYINPPDSSTI